MPGPDRYPALGPRILVASFDEALRAVRQAWPGAHAEGSTGAERTWWIREGGETRLVAHHWPRRRGAEEPLHLRIAPRDGAA